MSLKSLTFAALAVAGAKAAQDAFLSQAFNFSDKDADIQIRRDCLTETDAHGKDADDDPSYQPYRRAAFTEAGIESNMRITEITTCVGKNSDKVKGFGLKLSDPNSNDTGIELPFMGMRKGNCETV